MSILKLNLPEKMTFISHGRTRRGARRAVGRSASLLLPASIAQKPEHFLCPSRPVSSLAPACWSISWDDNFETPSPAWACFEGLWIKLSTKIHLLQTILLCGAHRYAKLFLAPGPPVRNPRTPRPTVSPASRVTQGEH